jgi:hypothetical protein
LQNEDRNNDAHAGALRGSSARMRLQLANAGAAAPDRLIFPLRSEHVVVMIHVGDQGHAH